MNFTKKNWGCQLVIGVSSLVLSELRQKRDIPSVSNEARQQEDINLSGGEIFLAPRAEIGKKKTQK